MKTVARLSAEDRSDLFRNTANRIVFVKLKGKNAMWHDIQKKGSMFLLNCFLSTGN